MTKRKTGKRINFKTFHKSDCRCAKRSSKARTKEAKRESMMYLIKRKKKMKKLSDLFPKNHIK